MDTMLQRQAQLLRELAGTCTDADEWMRTALLELARECDVLNGKGGELPRPGLDRPARAS